jgi:NAD(P)H dehydrogenase (quinone)
MKKVLIVYDSRTGRTQRMAERIADGIRSAGGEVLIRRVTEIKGARELDGYVGYVFGSPTYFKDMTHEMKTFLFMAGRANLRGKVGGAFGSYTHIGSGAKMIYDTMEHVFRMNMAEIKPFNVKEQILDAGKGDQPCRDYGKAVAEKI